MKISEMTHVTSLTGAESIEIVQNGVSKRCTLDQIAAAQPDSNGVYPDVPLNRVTLHYNIASQLQAGTSRRPFPYHSILD